MEYIYLLIDKTSDTLICWSEHRAALFYYVEEYKLKEYKIIKLPKVDVDATAGAALAT